jgi:hypothetical protein
MLSMKSSNMLYYLGERFSFVKIQDEEDYEIVYDGRTLAQERVRAFDLDSTYVQSEAGFAPGGYSPQTSNKRKINKKSHNARNVTTSTSFSDAPHTTKRKRSSSLTKLFNTALNQIGMTPSTSSDGAAAPVKKSNFAKAGKINANVRIQFDGEKYIYRV